MEKPSNIGWSYSCAIALNNNAVSLLSKGHLNEAMETFADGIQVLRNANEEPCAQREAEARQKVHKADQTLSESQFKKTSQPGCEGVEVQVITEDDIAESVRNIVHDAINSSQTLKLFLIRIELIPKNEVEIQKHMGGLIAALLLNNFGNAYISAAIIETNSHRALDLWEAAYKLFQLACSNLVAISSKNFKIEYDELTVRLFPLSVIILQNLDRISTVLGFLPDARTYHSTMIDVLESFIKMDALYRTFAGQAAAAAA
jgi:tetratricopeptide (TPR) repeat protein